VSDKRRVTDLKPGHALPLPAVIPRPTWWPVAAALGVMLVGWGLIASLIIFIIGATLLATSMAGWVSEIRHERNQS
jgi:hypothetical protein